MPSRTLDRADVANRISICYVAPGQHLVSTAGPTRNVLSLAQALSRRDDVTVAFRTAPRQDAPPGIRITEIQPEAEAADLSGGDSAVRGIGYGEFLAYLLALRRFARERLTSFDVVLEKSWLVSGYLSAHCLSLGIAAIPVENVVPVLGKGSGHSSAAYLRHAVARWLTGCYLRRAPRLIAETEPLKSAIVRRWRVQPERITVIGLGVDRERFRPGDQESARRRLGMAAGATVLLYVGMLDRVHDLGPVLRALGDLPRPVPELHVVGDGPLKAEYERLAGPEVFFHGRMPHEEVSTFIAASDLCLAPYDASTFPEGGVGYSTLKIREYLSAGRPVASVASGSVVDLVDDGVTGFLLPDDDPDWSGFLAGLPSGDRLREMGRSASRIDLPSWEDVAAVYRAVIEGELSKRARSRA